MNDVQKATAGIVAAARAVALLPIENAAIGFRDAESFGWALDPTAYRNSSSSRETGAKLIEAGKVFLANVRAALSEDERMVFDAIVEGERARALVMEERPR